MKKISLLLISVLLLSLTACASRKYEEDFLALRELFLQRGSGMEGYEVTEIESYDGFDHFCVRISLNAIEDSSTQDAPYYDANVLLFESEEEAEEAYQENQKSGVGGTCLKHERILMYWLEADPFADLYEEVFNLAFYIEDSEEN
jgi:hypothetical protein